MKASKLQYEHLSFDELELVEPNIPAEEQDENAAYQQWFTEIARRITRRNSTGCISLHGRLAEQRLTADGGTIAGHHQLAWGLGYDLREYYIDAHKTRDKYGRFPQETRGERRDDPHGVRLYLWTRMRYYGIPIIPRHLEFD